MNDKMNGKPKNEKIEFVRTENEQVKFVSTAVRMSYEMANKHSAPDKEMKKRCADKLCSYIMKHYDTLMRFDLYNDQAQKKFMMGVTIGFVKPDQIVFDQDPMNKSTWKTKAAHKMDNIAQSFMHFFTKKHDDNVHDDDTDAANG